MHWFILAVLAAICWGMAPVAAKLALTHVSPVVGMGVRSMIAAAVTTAWLMFSGHYRLVSNVDLKSMSWLLLEAVLATIVGDAFYFYALREGQAAQVGLIMASSPLITIVAANMLLDEPLTFWKLIGATMIIAGLLIIST